MPKYNEINKEVKVVIEPKTYNFLRLKDEEDLYKEAMYTANEIVEGINRHVDDIGDINITEECDYQYQYSEYTTLEGSTLTKLCECMAEYEDLITFDEFNNIIIVYLDHNNRECYSRKWSLDDLLYDIANKNVIKIEGKLSKRNKILVTMAQKLNDNELNIEFDE